MKTPLLIALVMTVAAFGQIKISGVDEPKLEAKPEPKTNQPTAAPVVKFSIDHIKWGMSKADLEAAFPGQIKPNPNKYNKERFGLPMLSGFRVSANIDGVVDEVMFNVIFGFEKDGLNSSYLDYEPTVTKKWHPEGCGRILYSVLIDKYGQPPVQRTLSNDRTIEWLTPTTKIRLILSVGALPWCALEYAARKTNSGL